MNTYINYDLHITQKGEDYHLRADCSLAGQETGQCTIPFSDEEIQGFLWQDMAFDPRDAKPKEIGRRLYDAIFQHNMGTHLRTCISTARAQKENLRIRLHLDESSQLTRLPWEYLYDTARDDFFALSIQTPIVRYVDLPIPESSMQVEDPLHILVMIADPVDLQPRLDVDREWIQLRSTFQDLEDVQKIKLHRLPNANRRELQRYLRGNRIDVFHFIGHGHFDEQDGEGLLAFEDNQRQAELVSADVLARLLRDEMPNLVYLNSCNTAQSGPYDPLTGTAQKLVQHGIPAVVAMQTTIQDDKAIQIAHEFYLALTDGYPVDAALVEGRKAVFNNNGLSQWGTPVLFMRAPDGILWNQEKITKMDNKLPDVSLPPPTKKATSIPPNITDGNKKNRHYATAIGAGLLGLIALLIAIYLTDSLMPSAFSCTKVSEIPQIECKALVEFYENTDGPNWTNNTGWVATDTPCNWYGVECQSGNIVQLKLTGELNQPFGLIGDLPPEIGRLKKLTKLDLSNNLLNTLPAEIGTLSNLEKLDLSENLLEALPAEIGTLSNLNELYVWNNKLQTLPVEIGNLMQLKILLLSGNKLRTLPVGISKLSNLEVLSMPWNQLAELPAEISNLTNLIHLDLKENELNTLPTNFVNLVNVKDLKLEGNHLDLEATDEALLEWMNTKDPDWANTQTLE